MRGQHMALKHSVRMGNVLTFFFSRENVIRPFRASDLPSFRRKGKNLIDILKECCKLKQQGLNIFIFLARNDVTADLFPYLTYRIYVMHKPLLSYLTNC